MKSSFHTCRCLRTACLSWDDIAFGFILASSFATFIALIVAAYEMRENRRERIKTHGEHEEQRLTLQNVSVNLLQFLDRYDRREEVDRAIDQGRKEGKDVTALVAESTELRKEERKLVTASLTAIYNLSLKEGAKVTAEVTVRKQDEKGNQTDETHGQS